MSDRVVFVDPTPAESIRREVLYLCEAWKQCRETNQEFALGGATGRTHIALYRDLFDMLETQPELASAGCSLSQVPVYFLDEYWSVPLYAFYARQHLRAASRGTGVTGRVPPQCAGFQTERIHVPRGSFYDANDRLIDSDQLELILREAKGEWEPRTEPGDDGVPPEVSILSSATHPVLRAVRDSNLRYHDLVSTKGANRLQLLGIGTQGHIGFVECGAARADSTVMLMRLCPVTLADNAADFQLSNTDGNAVLLPQSRFAITQGIGTILSARQLLLAAHGAKKQRAIRRMLLEKEGPQNPAGFVNHHSEVRVFLDASAWGDLSPHEIRDRGYRVEFAGKNS